ncbi:MAG TPA: CDP-alcohol phosphatidyltransferase family protein, partial [Dehalococcoidia bacterium]|nr:CDP-alcohol phosphatidyltransferase family protein [Dehalococcoidia bacterium]
STAPLVKVLARTRLTPNTLTFMGFLGGVAAGVVIAKEWLLLGGCLVLFSGAFDLFDGSLARAKGQSTKFGALLDSTLDRLGEAVVLLGLLILYLGQDSTWKPLLIYITFVGSVLVSYVKARAEGLGIKCEVGIFTRAERIIVLALGLILGHWIEGAVLIVLCILATLALVTVLQRLIYIRRWKEEEL